MIAFKCYMPNAFRLNEILSIASDCALAMGGPIVIPALLVAGVFLVLLVGGGQRDETTPPDRMTRRGMGRD